MITWQKDQSAGTINYRRFELCLYPGIAEYEKDNDAKLVNNSVNNLQAMQTVPIHD